MSISSMGFGFSPSLNQLQNSSGPRPAGTAGPAGTQNPLQASHGAVDADGDHDGDTSDSKSHGLDVTG